MSGTTGLTLLRRAMGAPQPAQDFNPASIPGLIAQFDASQITGIADAAALSSWIDLSGNGNDMSQGTPANQPTYYSSTAGKTVNGKPAVWFNATSDRMAETLNTYTLNELTIFFVGASNGYTMVSAAANGGPQFRYNTTANLELVKAGVASLGVSTGTISTGTQHAVAVRYDQPNSSLKFYIDSATADTTLSVNTALSPSALVLGYNPADNGEWWNGPMCEVLIFDVPLADSDLANLFAYSRAKWATP